MNSGPALIVPRQERLTTSQIGELRRFCTPTIANAIETFEVRDRKEGVTTQGVLCLFSALGPLVAYAATALIESSRPPAHPRKAARAEYWRYLDASGVEVSHGWAHLEDFGLDVQVFGMTVHSGDLIHADKHGAVVIPRQVAGRVAEAARQVEARERPMLEACGVENRIETLDRLIPSGY